MAKLKREKDSYLQSIQSQLMVFESHLKKSRNELDAIVKHKDDTIRRQHQLICSLTLALIKREGHSDVNKILPGLRLERSPSELSKNNGDETVSRNNTKNKDSQLEKDKKEPVLISSSKSDVESLNDSDSAIMMEDAYDSLIAMPTGKGEIKVMRSVSDALEIISRGVTSSLSNINKTNLSNSFRRPGSLSSTPSFSSEESDESPSSTINKHRSSELNEHKLSEDLLDLSEIGSTHCVPFSSSTPNGFYPRVDSPHNSHLQTLKEWDANAFDSPKLEASCVCQSSSCVHCESTSTTPLASPSASPARSRSGSPKPRSSVTKDKFDFDSDATLSDGQSEDGDGLGREFLPRPFPSRGPDDKRPPPFGFYEKLHDVDASYRRRPYKDELIQVTYNRVMSNHRSVTKPKDVKYKRINKAKSRSLEELRGKLKSFDGKQSFSVDLGQSDA